MTELTLERVSKEPVEIVVGSFSIKDLNITLHARSVDTSTRKLFLRFIGTSREDLLSLELTDGFVSAIELLVYEKCASIKGCNYDFDVADSGAVFVCPTNKIVEILDIDKDFSVAAYTNCIRLVLSDEEPDYTVLSGNQVVFEFGHRSQLCAVLLVNNIEQVRRLRNEI
ncbi:MAG: hypothetical protein DRR42_25090 [Gammaproteobacteria bacterium]|nr:MAG: hypothetical protein DRR42_25090 [Gammaproteobacteria bacterium]